MIKVIQTREYSRTRKQISELYVILLVHQPFSTTFTTRR